MSDSDIDPSDLDNERLAPSKTALKQAHKARQTFVRVLIDTPDGLLGQLGLSELAIEEIHSARSMSKSALKRQVGFISKLLGEEDTETAEATLTALRQPDAAANARFHKIEQWRDELINGDDETINRIVETLNANRQQLRTLVRQARQEQQTGEETRYAKLLFRHLRQLSEQ